MAANITPANLPYATSSAHRLERLRTLTRRDTTWRDDEPEGGR